MERVGKNLNFQLQYFVALYGSFDIEPTFILKILLFQVS